MSMMSIALSGVNAAQAGLNTTSQNTANLQTPGYSEQGVVLASVQPASYGNQSAGDGVAVTSIQRFSDQYTNLQLWDAASSLGESSSVEPFFAQLEQVMGDSTSGLGSALDGFSSALNAASENPASDPLRQQVIAAATSLAQEFNSQGQLLSQQMQAVNEQRSAVISQVNELTGDIAQLNAQIVAAQGTNTNISGLQDAIDQKIASLASYAGLQVTQQANGSLSVLLSSGEPLVEDSTAATLSSTTNPNGTQSLQLTFGQSSFTLGSSDMGGELAGLANYQSSVLEPMIQAITAMAQQVATSYNTQLEAGYTPAGTAGGPLFEFEPAGTTDLLDVTPGIQSTDLAFSSDPTSPGDSGNLTQLIAIDSQPVTLPVVGTVTLSDAMTQLVGTLGTQSQENQDAASTAQTVSDQAQANWQSVSGVNSNEEATNLVQYQQMYQANMQVIQVANTLFASTLAMFNTTTAA